MDDSSRLRPIFIEPQSIVALESFNHILYRPSETMIQSLMAAFLTALHQHSSPHHCPKSDLLKNNPLFILLLTKRIIIHSDTSLPYQPTKNQLEFTFQDIFLPAFLKIRLQHITNQSDSLAKQFIICLSTLATRILRSYHSRIDPIHQILLSVHHLISLQPPQLLSTFDHLSAVQNILTSLQKSRSIHSIFLLEQITRKHFEKLFIIYNHLIIISASISSELRIGPSDEPLRMAREQEYHKATSTIDVLLKIFRIIVEPLGDRAILVEVSKKFLQDFQCALDTENRLIMMEETDREEEDQDNQIKTFFSPHISRYGEVLLNVQHIHPSLISENYLSVYIKILEYVSSQLVTAHPVVTKRLVRFYPLILQAVRLLNNALNPYNSNSSEPAEGSNQMRSLLENLGPEEIHQLISIVQPFIHLQFGSMGYLDAHSDSEEDDVSEKYTEEVIEMEEMDGGDEDASIDVEDPANDEEIHITKGIQLDQDLKQSCLQPPPPTSDNQFPSPACPPLWTTLTKPDRPTKLSMKEPLQLEVEELLSILSF